MRREHCDARWHSWGERMTQQIIITTDSPTALRPLLTAAIRNELQTCAHGIKRTLERRATFEQRFAMSTAEFERRFNGADLSQLSAILNLEFTHSHWSGWMAVDYVQ